MKKITIFAIILLVAGMFSACKEEDPTVIPLNEDNLSDGTVSFTLSVQVIPSSEKGARVAGLDSAEVTINQSGNISKQIVGPDGIAVFSGLSETGVGTGLGVSIYVSKSGYASVNASTTLTRTINIDGTGVAGSGSDANHVQFEQLVVILPRLGASLTGKIYGDFDNDGNTGLTEFAAVNVRISFNNAIQPNVYETITSAADGSFTLSNLPESVGAGNPSLPVVMTCSYENTTTGVLFYAIPAVPRLFAGSTADLDSATGGQPLLITTITPPQNATLTGTIYGDFNSDGIALIDENRAVNVKVKFGNAVYETKTSATNGTFTLSNLPATAITSIALDFDDGSGGIYGPTPVAPVTLPPGGTIDLGSIEIGRTSPVQNMTLTGTIYGDFNNDGNTEVTEHRAVNVRISFGSVVYDITTSATTGIFTLLKNFSETTITGITTSYDDGSGGIYGGAVAGFPVTLILGETLDLGEIEAPRTSPVNKIAISGWIYGNWTRDTTTGCPVAGINTCIVNNTCCLSANQTEQNQYKNGKKIKLTYNSVLDPADNDVIGDVYYTTTGVFNSKNGHFEFTDLPAAGNVTLEIDFDPVLLITGSTGIDDTYYYFEFTNAQNYTVSVTTEIYTNYQSVKISTLTKP